MQLRAFIQAAILCAQLSSAAPTPRDVDPGISNLLGYIDNVISDLTDEKYAVIANDASSTGRSLAFLERGILPQGCTYSLPTSASTTDQAVAYLRAVQAELVVLSEDATNGDSANEILALCRAINLYGGIAAYVDSVRTDV
ncbi:hypothetical protein F5Y14DRAFT_382914 [Nemania sp. NC0429]|nr:hypothetical protein F5Y14DRAFT_382914 [Nemania sp. NC0429]